MYTKDPSLFLKKKDGKFESYSRMCAHNARRQPVLLTDEEKEKIDKEHPDSYNQAIHYEEYERELRKIQRMFQNSKYFDENHYLSQPKYSYLSQQTHVHNYQKN